MAQNKTIGELREIAKDLTNDDLQTLVALYGLTVAQDVAIEMLQDEPADVGIYPGTSLFDNAVDFVTDLLNEDAIIDVMGDKQLAYLFDVEVSVVNVKTVTPR
jgi:hypothetical protein